MTEWWHNFPWRVIQTNMREIDMKDLDAKRFVEDLISFDANVVMISFGGTLANYPSKVADHFINPHLTKDSLLTLVTCCHEAGIKVIARTDFSKMHQSIYEKHPEWAYRNAEGKVLDSNGYISTCKNGGFQQEFMDAVITEIITEFNVDGIYCNMGGFMIVDYNLNLHGPCHCAGCQRTFAETFELKLPEKDLPFASIADPSVAAYQRFKGQISAEQKERVTRLIHTLDSSVAYCSVDYTRLETNTELGRPMPHWQYSAASNARTMRGCGTEGEVASVDMLGFSARGTAISPPLHEYRLWQTLANFGGLDFFIMGRLDNKEDTSGYPRVKKIFSFAKEHEELFIGVESLASVLLVRDSYQIPVLEERGWVRALTELHIPFDEILSSCLIEANLSRYSLIILPDKPRLSELVCKKIDAFARDGGAVIAVGRVPQVAGRPLIALGVSSVGAFVEAKGASVLLSEAERAASPPLADRAFIPVGAGYYPYELTFEAKSCFTIIPPQRFGPPEVSYPNEEPTGFGGVVHHPYGAGRGLYIPWNIGTCYYQEGYDIWLHFLEHLLIHQLGIVPLSRTLSPMVEVTMGRKEEQMIVQLVNGSGHFGTSFFDPVPLYDQEIVLPWDGQEVSCRTLYHKENCTVFVQDGALHITIGVLTHYEGVIITPNPKEKKR